MDARLAGLCGLCIRLLMKPLPRPWGWEPGLGPSVLHMLVAVAGWRVLDGEGLAPVETLLLG
jgi:hypothetical protein